MITEADRNKFGISEAEAAVVYWVCMGLPTKDVAEKIFRSEKTVKFHLSNIYKRMQFKSRFQMILWGVQNLDLPKPPEPEIKIEPGDELPMGADNA